MRRFFQSGLIVIGDRSRWKMQSFFEVVKMQMIFQSGLIVMGNQVKNTKIFQSG